MKNRISFIDITKCFAIIFIVLGHTIVHSVHCKIIFKFLYSFHVILFFIISGYTFKINKNEKFLDFFKNKFLRIMIPYLIWATLFLIPYMFLGKNIGDNLGMNNNFNLKLLIFNIIYGTGALNSLKQNSSLWFLPALFSMKIIYYFIIKILDKHKNKNNTIVMLIMLVFIGYIANSIVKIIFPWGINTVLTLGFFFFLGYVLNQGKFLSNNKILKLKYVIIMFFVGIASFYFNKVVSCIDYDYGNYTLMIISSVCLSLVIIYISYIINNNKILEYIGKNTMGILIFHKMIILIFQTRFGIISKALLNSNVIIEMLISILTVILSITSSLLITKMIRKICPFLIGESNTKI